MSHYWATAGTWESAFMMEINFFFLLVYLLQIILYSFLSHQVNFQNALQSCHSPLCRVALALWCVIKLQVSQFWSDEIITAFINCISSRDWVWDLRPSIDRCFASEQSRFMLEFLYLLVYWQSIGLMERCVTQQVIKLTYMVIPGLMLPWSEMSQPGDNYPRQQKGKNHM